ncbi:MAG: hypothetical protein AAFO29_07615 [Actinomycetota bacterium]
MSHDRPVARPTPAELAVAELTLGSWTEVEHRLRPRLVPVERAGPIAIRPPTPPGFGQAPLAIDVGIDVPGGIVRIDEALWTAWEVTDHQIWSAARSRLAQHPDPTVRVVRSGPVELVVLLGDHWLTGLVLRPDRLVPTGLWPTRRQPAWHRQPTGPPVGSIIVAAASDRVLVVGPAEGPNDGQEPAAPTRPNSVDRATIDRVMALAEDLARLDNPLGAGVNLPLAPLLLPTDGSFPDRWILE